MTQKRILIIGGGPTGLGCAWRLKERGCENYLLCEANDYVGGLSASFKDDKGFTWDVGGHVLFSHYPWFDALFEQMTQRKYLTHIRTSFIRMMNRYVPYPFQNNLRYLPEEPLLDCLMGLYKTSLNSERTAPAHFREWLMAIFGEGVARHFMLPYNDKVWAQPLENMSAEWIAERVSVVDFKRVLSNVILKKDDVSWGPNSVFRFPEEGGTGAIFKAFLPGLDGHVRLNCSCVEVNTETKTALFSDGSRESWDVLVNSAPLDRFVSMLRPARPDLVEAAKGLVATSGLMLGLGFARPCPSDKNWVYFPETANPIYRLTWFSNYSQKNAPDENHFSLMGEISYSPHRPADHQNAVNAFIRGLIDTGVIEEAWTNDIVSTNVIDVPYSYPVPTLGRNAALRTIIPALETLGIYSRGRFGLWLYEIGNMDHSVMQGAELVDHLLEGTDQPTIAPYSFLKGGAS